VRRHVLIGDPAHDVSSGAAELADEVLLQLVVGGHGFPQPVELGVFFADVAIE
jgi:hypothetical protein